MPIILSTLSRGMRRSRRWFLHRLAAMGVLTLFGSSCERKGMLSPVELPATQTPTPQHAAETPTARAESGEIQLPQPRTKGSMSLEEAMFRRRSVRMYRHAPLSSQDIAQLFWAAQGVTVSWGGRTAPSAGALYPLEIYAATANGVYHYLPRDHRAEITVPEDIRQALWAAGLYQESLAQAPVIFAITAVYRRTEIKYGERAERYIKLEAGHAAQNLLLQAVTLDLGAVVIGAFYDEMVASALRLPATERPLYLIPVGHLVG